MRTRTPLTVEETIALAALGCVRFPTASWDKRFVRSLYHIPGLTDKERPQLWRLFIRYRRQIDCPRKAELLKLAETLSAPDLRKVAAAQRAQAEIDALKEKYAKAMEVTP
jgi:hypothetical protein